MIDNSKLTIEQQHMLETRQQNIDMITTLEHLATMADELVKLAKGEQKLDDKKTSDMGALLMDMRESLDVIKERKDPLMPDYAKPVVEAVSKMEKALTEQLKAIDVKPGAPIVNVPKIDLSALDSLKDLPKAFNEAIAKIPKVDIPKTDFQPFLDIWKGISKQLVSIETATRLKPQPGSLAVSNLSEVVNAIENHPAPLAVELDTSAPPLLYVGKAPIGSDTSMAVWQIARLDVTSGLIKKWADGDSEYNNVFDNRSSLTYI